MTRFDDQQFREKHILVDGHHYVNCTFHDCHIEYGGGDIPVLFNTHMERCQFNLSGSAKQTAEWLRMVFAIGGVDLLKGVLHLPMEE